MLDCSPCQVSLPEADLYLSELCWICTPTTCLYSCMLWKYGGTLQRVRNFCHLVVIQICYFAFVLSRCCHSIAMICHVPSVFLSLCHGLSFLVGCLFTIVCFIFVACCPFLSSHSCVIVCSFSKISFETSLSEKYENAGPGKLTWQNRNDNTMAKPKDYEVTNKCQRFSL